MRYEISPLDLERFYSKIKFNEETWCWDWIGTTLQRGYDHFKLKGKTWRPHRLSYLLHKGDLIEGLTLDHLCRNRACVNPEHLEQVPIKVNILRGESPSAKNSKKTHCKRGHKFTPENTYTNPKGKRSCRKCQSLHASQYYHQDPEKSRAIMRGRAKIYRQKNPERIRAYDRNRYQKKKINTN